MHSQFREFLFGLGAGLAGQFLEKIWPDAPPLLYWLLVLGGAALMIWAAISFVFERWLPKIHLRLPWETAPARQFREAAAEAFVKARSHPGPVFPRTETPSLPTELCSLMANYLHLSEIIEKVEAARAQAELDAKKKKRRIKNPRLRTPPLPGEWDSQLGVFHRFFEHRYPNGVLNLYEANPNFNSQRPAPDENDIVDAAIREDYRRFHQQSEFVFSKMDGAIRKMKEEQRRIPLKVANSPAAKILN